MAVSYNNYTISDLVDKVNDKAFLPDIQREYVWLEKNTDKIESLFDSVRKRYPVGNLLFWIISKTQIVPAQGKVGGSNDVQLYKFLEFYMKDGNHNSPIYQSQINHDDVEVVLDGQQRLTSLYIGLKGYIETKNAKKTDKMFLYCNFDSHNSEGSFFKFLTNSQASAKKHERWFLVGDIIYADQSQLKALASGNIDMYSNLTALREVFKVEKVINVCELNKGTTLDVALEIFVRINSGGQILSYSDLLMSYVTNHFKTINIRQEIVNVVDDIQNGTYDFPCFTRDTLLKTCLLLSGANHEFNLANFNYSNVAKIESNWSKIVSAIKLACQVIKDQGYSKILSSGYVISVIAFYLYNQGLVTITSISGHDKDYMRKFIMTVQIRGYFSASTDTKLSAVKAVMNHSSSFDYFYKGLIGYSGFAKLSKVTIKDIPDFLNSKYGNKGTFSILQILYPLLSYNTRDFDLDHIYPKSHKIGGVSLNDVNNIANLQMLEHIENISKGKNCPLKWASGKFSASIKNYYDENFIPSASFKGLSSLTQTDFDAFISARKKMLDAEFNKAIPAMF